MNIAHKINRFLVEKVALPWFEKRENVEKEIAQKEGIIQSTDNSPERFDIIRSIIKLPNEYVKLPGPPQGGVLINRCVSDGIKSMRSIKHNPSSPKETITQDELQELEEYAHKLGVSSIGYAKLEERMLFKDMGIMFDNAIVLAIEMDSKKIQQAPSAGTEYMVLKAYYKLGKIGMKLSRYLRKKGFAAHPTHPLMGETLFPPLAEKAGIGYHGLQGLIITPEFGPRVRLAAVYTNVTNLPTNPANEHEWIADYCKNCQICIEKCPGEAVLRDPIFKENGQITHIDNTKCLPYFASDDGCAICIKVCPFSKHKNPISLKDQIKAS